MSLHLLPQPTLRPCDSLPAFQREMAQRTDEVRLAIACASSVNQAMDLFAVLNPIAQELGTLALKALARANDISNEGE